MNPLNAELILDDLWGADERGLLQYLRGKTQEISISQLLNIIMDYFDLYGLGLNTITVHTLGDQYDWPSPGNRKRKSVFFNSDKLKISLDILESLNLVQEKSFRNMEYKSLEISVFYCIVTPLALDLYSACNPDKMKHR